jgi:acyl-CoA thioester hydrolase
MAGMNDKTFTWPVRVYWEDTDAGGIVFYANYLKYFERARTEWLRALGLSQQELRQRTGGMFVVSEVSLKYQKPARLDDELRVSARVTELGRSSFTMAQQVWLHSASLTPGEPILLCSGQVRIGWVNGSTLKPERIPTPILQALQT